MKNNNCVGVLYHGSSRLIHDTITLHKGHNQSKDKNLNLYGIYATPDFVTAVVYTMGVERTSLTKPKIVEISYSYEKIVVKMCNCRWNRKDGYVYVIDSVSFQKINEFEYVSTSNSDIKETIVIRTKDICELIDRGKIELQEDQKQYSQFTQYIYNGVDSIVSCVSSCINLYHRIHKLWNH